MAGVTHGSVIFKVPAGVFGSVVHDLVGPKL